MKTNRITFWTIRGCRLAGGVAVLLALGPAEATVERASFNRYEVILNRRPFGAVPPEVGPGPGDSKPLPPPPEFAARLKMVAITDRGGQVRVGFVDNSEKPPKTYFLFVGDSQNGYQVIRADYQRESAVVRKDGHEVELSMSGATGRGGLGHGVVSAVAAQATPSPRSSERRPVPRPESNLTREQLNEEINAGIRAVPISPRRMMRKNEGQPDIADLPPELREHAMRKYNLELIRAGGEKGIPLPIPLTPEEDAMLVNEGVLPPQ